MGLLLVVLPYLQLMVGKVEYATVDGDLSGAGNWELQAKIVSPDGSWSTDVGNFRVYENLY